MNNNKNKKYQTILKIILDNFKINGYKKEYQYLNDNYDNLINELVIIDSFFQHLRDISNKSINHNKKIELLINIPNNEYINKQSAELILFFYNFNYNTKSNSDKSNNSLIKKNLKKTFKYLRTYILDGGTSNVYDTKIYDQLKDFETINNKYVKENLSSDISEVINLNRIPKTLHKMLDNEYKIPININDILLIGFSVFPTIGWIFDLFLIFRSLLEKRYIFAILMIINCYQLLFYKLISFGFLGMDFGPLIKLFYLAPYGNKEFNFKTFKDKINEFLSTLDISFKHEINLIQNK